MARSDLLVSLVKAGSNDDATRARSVAEAIIAEERAKRHNVLAERLMDAMGGSGAGPVTGKFVGHGQRHRAAVLPARSLEPRHRALLVGPPGNGKTSPATIAKALGAISYAGAEEFCRDVRRRSALAMEEQPLKLIVAERLKLWTERSRSMTNDGAEAQHLPPVCERSGKRGIAGDHQGGPTCCFID